MTEYVALDAQTKSLAFDHRELGLSDDDIRRMYELMLLGRRFDERCEILQRQGKAHFHISGQGQEAAQIGAAMAFIPGKDWFHPYYRDLALLLAIGVPPRELMLGWFARANDPASGGRQMPAHWGYRPLNVVTASSPVSTQIPQAAGIAYAHKLRGEDAVTYVSFGEGGSSKGDFHEGLNFAAIHKVPVVFVCMNNGYAISVSANKQMAIENVADRAAGYGMPGVVVDGQDMLAVYKVMKEAVDRARRGEGPTLVECKTVRLKAHSSDDDDRLYRSREEIERLRQEKDPLVRARAYLLEQGLADDAWFEEIEKKVMDIVNDATDWAEAQPLPRPEDAMKHVYWDR